MHIDCLTLKFDCSHSNLKTINKPLFSTHLTVTHYVISFSLVFFEFQCKQKKIDSLLIIVFGEWDQIMTLCLPEIRTQHMTSAQHTSWSQAFVHFAFCPPSCSLLISCSSLAPADPFTFFYPHLCHFEMICDIFTESLYRKSLDIFCKAFHGSC